jgi:uncharacterized protein (TIGR03032 family)
LTGTRDARRAEAWTRHGAEWRDPIQIVADWDKADSTDPGLLRYRARGGFWEVLERTRSTLLISREYEHLLIGITVREGTPYLSYLPLPHPSGIAVDRARRIVHVASTRNPNRIYDFIPATATLDRGDSAAPAVTGRPLVPLLTRFYPGALYVHDLALVGGQLHANSVGENAVARLGNDGSYERAWWPRAIESGGRPDFSRNYLQLNSIAAGKDLRQSFFTASAAKIGRARPGQRNFRVDRRGVVLSGATREPIAGGLTRPHSARLHRGRLWTLDSGYGGVCIVREGAVETISRLPGWTRGLGFRAGVAFVGTSRVIPRFGHYAPGLDLDRSVCGVHALDVRSGELLGSLVWPDGNQVFAVEPLPASLSVGFPLPAGARRPAEQVRRLFYGYAPPRRKPT